VISFFAEDRLHSRSYDLFITGLKVTHAQEGAALGIKGLKFFRFSDHSLLP